MSDLKELLRLLSKLPKRYELRMSYEPREGYEASLEKEGDGDDETFFGAVIMERPPLGGWRTHHERFGYPVKPEGEIPCPPQWRFDTAARVSTSADEPKAAARLTLDMLASFLEKLDKRGAR